MITPFAKFVIREYSHILSHVINRRSKLHKVIRSPDCELVYVNCRRSNQ